LDDTFIYYFDSERSRLLILITLESIPGTDPYQAMRVNVLAQGINARFDVV